MSLGRSSGTSQSKLATADRPGSRSPTADRVDQGFLEALGVSKRTAEARWAAWVRARL